LLTPHTNADAKSASFYLPLRPTPAVHTPAYARHAAREHDALASAGFHFDIERFKFSSALHLLRHAQLPPPMA